MHSIKAAALMILAASGALARYSGYLNARDLDLDDHLDLAIREAYDDGDLELDLYARDLDDFKNLLYARALTQDPDMFASYSLSRRGPPKNTPEQEQAAKAAFRQQAMAKLEGKHGGRPLPETPRKDLPGSVRMYDKNNPHGYKVSGSF